MAKISNRESVKMVTSEGVTRPDGTIVPKDHEWSIVTPDGLGIAWDAMAAPAEYMWDIDSCKWIPIRETL